jgi:uncharacterized protein YndB with AHSA1/START domain
VLKKLVILVAILVATLVLVGMVLPREITVTRSVVMAAPAERIYPLIATPAEWPTWSPWNRRDPAMEITYSGPATGTGARWDWKSKSEGDGGMVFTETVEPSRATFELTIAGMGPPSVGTFTLTPAASGTEVTWTMTSDLGAGPVGRWFGLVFPRLLGKDFDEALATLKARVEAPPSP